MTLLNCVCTTDADGHVIKYYGGLPESANGRLKSPVRLAVRSDGSILVIYRRNNRVLLLSSSLDVAEELLPPPDVPSPWYPVRMCLDENHRRLLVVENERNGEGFTNSRVVVCKLFI